MLKDSRLIPQEEQERLLKEYPLYSQDGKKGEAIAVLRLWLASATYYVLEVGDLEGDMELFIIYDDGHTTEYGYQLLSELEEASVDVPLYRAEGMEPFTLNVKTEREKVGPTMIKEIPQLRLFLYRLYNDDLD